jgi:hypothetical protein
MSAKREYRLFTRASGRGLRRVKNVVQDAKGMCKKNEHAAWPSDELPKKNNAHAGQMPTQMRPSKQIVNEE